MRKCKAFIAAGAAGRNRGGGRPCSTFCSQLLKLRKSHFIGSSRADLPSRALFVMISYTRTKLLPDPKTPVLLEALCVLAPRPAALPTRAVLDSSLFLRPLLSIP